MDKEQRIAYINAMTVCAQIECAGMVAENEQRKAIGASMAYTEEAFLDVINKYDIHHRISYLLALLGAGFSSYTCGSMQY